MAEPEIWPQPALADRACADRRSRRPAAASRRRGIIASMQPTHQTSDRLMAEKRLGPNRLDVRLCVAVDAEDGRKACVRNRLPGGIAEPLPGPFRGDQPAGHQRPAAGRLVSVGTADLRAGARRLHARRRLRRFRRGQDRRARAGQMGGLHHRRPRSDQDRPAIARAHAGARDLGCREEGLEPRP